MVASHLLVSDNRSDIFALIQTVFYVLHTELLEALHHLYQVITGYLLAGSIVGPGGLSFVSEMVQVCSFSSLIRFNLCSIRVCSSQISV